MTTILNAERITLSRLRERVESATDKSRSPGEGVKKRTSVTVDCR